MKFFRVIITYTLSPSGDVNVYARTIRAKHKRDAIAFVLNEDLGDIVADIISIVALEDV